MAANTKQQINQLLMKIDAAALAQDYDLIESLVLQCRTLLSQADDQVDCASVENSLAVIMNVVRDHRGRSPVSSSYRADRPKTGINSKISIKSFRN